ERGHDAHPDGFGYVYVAEEGDRVGAPDEEARRGFIELLRSPPPALKAAAVVVLRTGFSGVAVRAVVSGVLLTARTRGPVKVFSAREEAAEWLAHVLAGTRPPSSGDLRRAAAAASAAIAHKP